jgi:hypothetical protein
VKWSSLRRRPSPAMIVALIALFVSLSGVSYGVVTGFIDSREIKNNEIRSIDVRNNQLRSIDIRNNEVRGRDIRNSTIQSQDVAINAITGDDVKEDTLQQVPSALLADTATKADSATTADGVDTLKIIPRTVVAEGTGEVTLATHGPLTLKAACVPNATSTQATLSIQTSEDNSAAWTNDVARPVLDAGDGTQTLTLVNDAAGGTRTIDLRDVAASAPSGKAFTGEIVLMPDAAGAGSCTFHGHLALQG